MTPSRKEALEEAADLMQRFADRTGLGSGRPAVRYLWTDAFAVCNELALERATGARHHRERALALVDQVHRVLGRHRPDDARRGCLSGLEGAEAHRHPTRGGLRIGKRLPERPADAPLDETLEWDRDGQYFHYLTRWMHALDQTARATRDPRFNVWARELAEVSQRAFVCGAPGRRRMMWKMSIDLSRPLVASMAPHDPLEGWITCLQLRATAQALLRRPSEPRLEAVLADFARLTESTLPTLATRDPLGLGGLLIDAARAAQLIEQGALSDGSLLEVLLGAALEGLPHLGRRGELYQPASRRLAFRELGLVIGLSALGPIGRLAERGLPASRERDRLRVRLEALAPYTLLGDAIASFWRDPGVRETRLWSEHRDINEVMLATALVPEGVLVLRPLRGAGVDDRYDT
jgi:hypothetical protein